MRISGRLQRQALTRFNFFAPGFGVIQRSKAPADSASVDVALCEHSAQPGLQRAPAMKIAEERTFTGLPVTKPIKLCEKRVRQFASFRRTRAAAQHRAGSGAQIDAIHGDEMLPGRLASRDAGSSQGQVLKMQRREVLFKFCGGDGSTRKVLLHAVGERGGKALPREIPARGR